MTTMIMSTRPSAARPLGSRAIAVPASVPASLPAHSRQSRTGSGHAGQVGAPQVTSPSVRITRRGRLVVTFAAACGLAAVMMGAATWIAPAPAVGSVPTVSYVVQPGDTWWSIAANIPEHGDIRGTVDVLRRLNPDLAHGLMVGAQIAVPRTGK